MAFRTFDNGEISELNPNWKAVT